MWLWKLIADPYIARSRMLNNFLELTDAARMVTKCVSTKVRVGVKVRGWVRSGSGAGLGLLGKELGLGIGSARGVLHVSKQADHDGKRQS